MSDSWYCWSSGQSCEPKSLGTIATVIVRVFASPVIIRVELWWSLATRLPLEPFHSQYRCAPFISTLPLSIASIDCQSNLVNRLLADMWPRVKCQLTLLLFLSFTDKLLSTKADEKVEITSTLSPTVSTPPQQVVICQPPIDLTVDSSWLENVVFGNFRVWHVMFSTIAVLTGITVVLCCLFRCRIPRTKQEIEADFIRKRITKSFRSHLNKIKLEELEFDPENLLPVFQKVENLEETRVSKHRSFEMRKLTWKQKLKQFFSGKELSFDDEFGEHGDEQKGDGSTSQPMTKEEMEKVEQEVECAKIDSTAFNVISDQIAILSYFESDKNRRKRLKEERKAAKELKKEQKKQEQLEKKQKKEGTLGKSSSERKSLAELKVENLEKGHKLTKSQTIDETGMLSMEAAGSLEIEGTEVDIEKELEENGINQVSIAVPQLESPKKSTRFSFREAVSSLISKGFRKSSPKETKSGVSSSEVVESKAARDAMVINIEMVSKQSKDDEDQPQLSFDATIPQIHVPGDHQPSKSVPTNKRTKTKLHKTESIDRNRLQIPEISVKEVHPERSKDGKHKISKDKKTVEEIDKTCKTDISQQSSQEFNLQSQSEPKPKPDKISKTKDKLQQETKGKTQSFKIIKEEKDKAKKESKQKKIQDKADKLSQKRMEKEMKSKVKSKLKIEDDGKITLPSDDGKAKKLIEDSHSSVVTDDKPKEKKHLKEGKHAVEVVKQQSKVEKSQAASGTNKAKQLTLQADTACMSPSDLKPTKGHQALHKDEVVIHLELKPKMSPEAVMKEAIKVQAARGVSKKKKKESEKAKSKPNKMEFDQMVLDLNAELKQKVQERRLRMMKRSQTVEEGQLNVLHTLPGGDTSGTSRDEFKKRLSEVLIRRISDVQEADVVRTTTKIPPRVSKKPKVVRKQTTTSSSEIEIPVEHVYTRHPVAAHSRVNVEVHPSDSEPRPESISTSSILLPSVTPRTLSMSPLRAEHSVERFTAASPTGENRELRIECTRDVILGLPSTSRTPLTTRSKPEITKKVTLQEVPQEIGHLPSQRTGSRSRKESDHHYHQAKHKKSSP